MLGGSLRSGDDYREMSVTGECNDVTNGNTLLVSGCGIRP